jgi:hypothetical protein
MKHIYITTFALVITYLLLLSNAIPKAVAIDAPLTQTGAHATGRKLSREDATITKMLAERKDSADDAPVPVAPIVAQYSQSNRAWNFFATVVQLKDVSIYGRSGTIARVEYMREGEPQYSWAVIKIDDYYFSDSSEAIAEGQEIMLEVSGDHVSAQGVNWDNCPYGNEYCQYASFIEGGFPVSEDYNGLTMCPSNMLIYSGYLSDDWINGMLEWKIKAVPVKAAQDCIHCPSGTRLNYFP